MIMANEILVTIKKRKICATVNTNITTGSVDSVQCTFTYDEEWEQLAKTAIFKASNEKIYPIFLEGNTCNVPPEVLTEGECFGIGVMGAQGEWMVIPSTMVRVSLEKGCYTAPFPITKDVYLQIVTLFCEKTAELEEMTKKVEQAADEILGSIADIKEAEETVIEKAAQASNAAKEAEQHELKAQGYADDAQKSAQSAKDSEDNIKNMKTDIHADAETAAQKAAEAVAAAGEAGTARDKAKEYQDAAQASAADALASAQAATESEENTAAIQSEVQRLAGQVNADKADVTSKAQTVALQAQQVQEYAEEAAKNLPLIQESAQAASAKAEEAAESAANAKASEINAKESEDSSNQNLSDFLAMLGTDVATLVGGKIPAEQIPAIATTEVYTVATEEEMGTLVAQNGDICIRTDENKSYIYKDTGWVYLASPTDYASSAGHADTADNAVNASMINNHRLVEMTPEEFETAVKDPDTYYLVG